jgi:hypothetical protein
MRHASSFCLLAGIAVTLAFVLPASAADYDYQAVPAYAAPASYAMVVEPQPGAVRYNRPCSVSDGYRTIVVACQSAAATVAGMSYVPPVVTYTEPAVDPVVYADYARYRPYRAYRSSHWRRHGHVQHRWSARSHHGARHAHVRHHHRR